MPSSTDIVKILVLGAGWTSQFLISEFEKAGLSYTLTTRSGQVNDYCKGVPDESYVVPFTFRPDPEPGAEDLTGYDGIEDEKQYSALPTAETVIITFPLKGVGQSKKLVEMYQRTHAGHIQTKWIQLGSTGIYKGDGVFDQESNYEKNPRAVAEDELINMGGAALNLAGLWGADRVPWNWVRKIAPTKEKLAEKKSLHLIHGNDVAKACVAFSENYYAYDRWLITDMRVYDWWELISWWADDLEAQAQQEGLRLEYKRWIAELMEETGVDSLPRTHAKLGRVLDSSKFWELTRVKPETMLRNDGINGP